MSDDCVMDDLLSKNIEAMDLRTRLESAEALLGEAEEFAVIAVVQNAGCPIAPQAVGWLNRYRTRKGK